MGFISISHLKMLICPQVFCLSYTPELTLLSWTYSKKCISTVEYRGHVCKDGVCTLSFLQNVKSHKTHPTDQVRTSPRSENAQWGLSDRVWGSLCPHTTSAALGSWSATPSSLLEGPGTALTTWTTQILLRTIPEVWASEQQLRGLNPWVSLSFLQEFPCQNNLFLASSEHSQLYLKCKGAEKTELLPELQNSTSIFFFFLQSLFFLSSFEGVSVMATCS